MHQGVIFVPKTSTQENNADPVDPPKDLHKKKSFSVYYGPLKTIALEKDRGKAYNSVYEISNMLQEIKPQYKSLEDELVAIVKTEMKYQTDNKAKLLEFIINNLLEAYEVAYLEGLHDMLSHLFITVISRLKTKFANEFTKEVNDILLTFWTRVDSYHMSNYLETLELSNIVKYEDMVPVIKNLIQSQFYEDAANFIAMFKLHKHFDIESLLIQLVNGKYFAAISYFVEEDSYLREKAINELIFQKNSSEAADLVKKFKLDPYQFPTLISSLEKSSLRYHAKADWFVVEEKFYDQKHILSYYVDDLIRKKNNFDVAISLVIRHQLHKEKGLFGKRTLDDIAPYLREPSAVHFKYMENPLFKFDTFAPTEEIIGAAQPGAYVHLKDFKFDVNKDIIFIDDCESEAFDLAIKDLLTSEAVGLDSEFKFTLTKFDFQPTALLQLATQNKIYLLDSLKLINSSKYNNFITELLANPAIQKVGHTLSADLHKLRATRENDAHLKVENEVDIAKIYRKLYPEEKKYGLATICEQYLKKPMSKYDQVSNWSHRPLRKAQMHYGGLDAFIVLKLFEKLKEEILSKGEEVKTYLEDPVAQQKEPKDKARWPRSRKDRKERKEAKEAREAPTEEVKQNEENLGDTTQGSETKHKKSRRRPYQRKNEPKEKQDDHHRGGQHENDLQEKPNKASHAKNAKGKPVDRVDGQVEYVVKEYKPKKTDTSKNIEETTEKKVE